MVDKKKSLQKALDKIKRGNSGINLYFVIPTAKQEGLWQHVSADYYLRKDLDDPLGLQENNKGKNVCVWSWGGDYQQLGTKDSNFTINRTGQKSPFNARYATHEFNFPEILGMSIHDETSKVTNISTGKQRKPRE